MAKAEDINPRILTWARETAGLSIGDAADFAGFGPGASVSPAQKLEALEKGSAHPTRGQLAKLANVYRRPLITFYLRQPPQKGVRGEDFRTSGSGTSERDNAMLDALLRDIRSRQEMIRSLLEDEGDRERLSFVGSASMSDGVDVVASKITKMIGGERQSSSSRYSPDDVFRDLRAKAEKIGVFVLLAGDLGSYHSAIGENVFRGFAIADDVAPFVVINDQDAKVARSFTLLHELVHIWLGQTGVSGGQASLEATTEKGSTERFCDDVASAVLLPSSIFAAQPDDFDGSDEGSSDRFVSHVAAAWGVSEAAVAYRLRRMNWITAKVHQSLQTMYGRRWRALKQKLKADTKESEGGPSFYTVKSFKLGDALIEVIRRSLRNEDISYTKAAKVLGVKPGIVEPLIRRAEERRRS